MKIKETNLFNTVGCYSAIRQGIYTVTFPAYDVDPKPGMSHYIPCLIDYYRKYPDKYDDDIKSEKDYDALVQKCLKNKKKIQEKQRVMAEAVSSKFIILQHVFSHG
jgi:hypothetical protein